MRDVPLVIYHADCNDGLTAAWVVQKFYREKKVEVDLYAAKYQQPPPDVTGRLVILVDFSYKRSVLKEMLAKAKFIIVLDHHKSAEADIGDLGDGENTNLWVTFDMERSGAGIAWDYFYRDEPRPWFVDYVEDNDLWRHKLPDCKEVLEFIRSYPAISHFDYYDLWMKACPTKPDADMVIAGKHIYRAKQRMVEQALTFSRRVDLLVGDGPYQGVVSALVCNVPFFLNSEVAGALAEKNLKETGVPLGITYYQRDGKWDLSFRSRGDMDFDVSKLASSFGGGGHKSSAGATINTLPWEQKA